MKYINEDDLITYIQELLLNSSIAGSDTLPNEDILTRIEKNAIDVVISYIGGRYDVSKIFANEPIRNGVLVGIISQIVIYRAVKRNAARKVPDDFNTLYSDAIKSLEKIQGGSQYLPDLPKVVPVDGGTTASLMYGNSTNKDYFL